MSLLVHNPGMLASVQDLGRNGFASIGVARSGAADPLSLCMGNRLIGNPDSAAAIELTLAGGLFEFTHALPIVLAGANANATLLRRDGTRTPVHMWTPLATLPGDVLTLGAIGGPDQGCRAYLCVMGGIDAPLVMNSRATQVGTMTSGGEWSGGVGGLGNAPSAGTPLRAGDALATIARAERARTRLIPASLRAQCQESITRRVLRITPGPQWTMLSDAARHALASPRRVLDRFDRRGVRLSPGIVLESSANAIPTQPTDVGFVQAPGSAELIILGSDGPPTGGYPVVACVASIDLPTLGQLRPHDTIRFDLIDVPRARALLHECWREIDRALPEVR